MKKANSKKLLVALLVLNISAPSAHAGTFDSLKEKAAKLLEKSKEVGSKAIEKGKEITIVVADYANEKLEESRQRYDDLNKDDQSSSSSQSNEVLEDLPQNFKIALNDSKDSKDSKNTSNSTNSNNSQIISSGENKEEVTQEDGKSENDGQHLGTISEKNPNSSQTQNKPNLSQEKKVGLFPWENEQPQFQVNTKTTVYNSLYSFKRRARIDSAQWALIAVTHQETGKSEQYIYKVENGEFDGQIAFKYGAGGYEIAVHETRSSQRITTYSGVERYSIKNLDTRDLMYLLPSNYVQSKDEEIIALAKEIVSGAKTQREAVVRINRWLMDNIEYDWSAYNDKSYVNKDYSAKVTRETRVAVCQGFANLFAALSRASGIRARVVSGIGISNVGGGGPHAWNQVYIEGQWLNIDATWDQNIKDERYIFMSDANFGRTHQNAKVNEDY